MPLTSVLVDGTRLTCDDVVTVARHGAVVIVAEAGLARAHAAAAAIDEIAATGRVYGRTTGVGANREVDVAADDDHGRRLLRSHAGGAGPALSRELVRAMLVVRVNQLAAGGSGVAPELLHALAEALNRGLHPRVPSYGAIGTGDLTALAATALSLLGERPWDAAGSPPAAAVAFPLRSADALAFLSSNAATLGEAALACHDLRRLLDAAIVVAALAFLAVAGSAEPYAVAVQAARPHPGQQAVAARLRGLLEGEPLRPTRIQDPYGYRALPQVHGPAVDALGHAEQVVTREINAAAENPLVDVAARRVWHNGNFHSAYVGLALDAVRAALFQTAALTAARLGTLVEPAFTGLPAFLAGDPRPSSGIMILEYVAHSAIADIRRLAAPAALGSAVLSRGVEEHAGFATQSARATTDVVDAYRVAVSCELVAAVRALRMRGAAPVAAPLRAAFELADARLDRRLDDRPLDGDLAAAATLLDSFADLLTDIAPPSSPSSRLP